MTVEVKVFEADNTTEVTNLTTARQVRELRGKDLLVGVGDGSVSVDFDHPEVAELTGGRIVQVHDGARVPLAFTIDKKREVLVPSEPGDANRIVTVSGQTLRGRLKYGRVLPWLPVASEGVADVRPITRRRLFNPASPVIDLDDWTTPFEQERLDTAHIIKAWPSEDSEWIWGTAETLDMPLGDCWFAYDFTLADEEIVVFMVTGDDQFVDYLQGCELQREDPEYPAFVWQDIWRSAVKLQAGTYRYVIKGTNDDQKGAVRCEAWKTSSSGITDRVFQTDAAGLWKCLAYPDIGDAGYGHTAGHIMDLLLNEAQARGELSDLTWDFTPTLDSNGDAWADLIPEIDFDATGTIADAVDKLEDSGYVDVQMSYSDGLELRLFNAGARGETKPITISTANQNLVSHAVETDYSDIKNDVLLVHDRGMYLMDDDPAIAIDGRLPGGALQVGPIGDPTILEQIGAAYLDGATGPGESVIVETTPMFDVAAEPGDRVTVEGDELRIAELGFELDLFGELRTVPVLSTPYQEQRKKAERVVDRLVRENGNSASASKVLDTGTNIPSGKLSTIRLTSWSWTLPEDLEESYWDLSSDEPVGWQPWPVEEFVRIYRMQVECAWAEPDGLGGRAQVSEGPSQFTLMVDGLPTAIVVDVPETSGSTDPNISVFTDVWGPFQVGPGQRLSVSPTLNGAHIEGSVTILATAAL